VARVDGWIDGCFFFSLLSLSFGDESYSQGIMMMMMMAVVTGTEMPHIETRIPFFQSFF
jgi:hypothetical protein